MRTKSSYQEVHPRINIGEVEGITDTPTDTLLKEAQAAFKSSMTRWSCNSHYVSHFAAFFIVVGT
jgi:hypothetical protein